MYTSSFNVPNIFSFCYLNFMQKSCILFISSRTGVNMHDFCTKSKYKNEKILEFVIRKMFIQKNFIRKNSPELYRKTEHIFDSNPTQKSAHPFVLFCLKMKTIYHLLGTIIIFYIVLPYFQKCGSDS